MKVTHTTKKLFATIGIAGLAFVGCSAEEMEAYQAEQETADASETEELIELPNLTGMNLADAEDELDDLELATDEHDVSEDDKSVWSSKNWEVVDQDPAAGEQVEIDTEVLLGVQKIEDEEDLQGDATQAPEELPEGIDAQIAALQEHDDFEEAEIYYADGDDINPNTSVNIALTIEPGWSESTMCTTARDLTIEGLQFLRDNVDEPYEEAVFTFTSNSEEDATGDSTTLSMANVTYEHDTVQNIDDDSANTLNIWEAADQGGTGPVCERAES